MMKCLYLVSVVFHVAAGCELVKKTEVEHVTVFTGQSVVLPCVCTDLQDKPRDKKWQFYINNHFEEIYPKQTGHHRNRVKLVSNKSPGNLSLLISDLTEEDQGDYTCAVQNNKKQIRLSVKGKRETSTLSRKTDTTSPPEHPQSKTTHSPPASQQTHNIFLPVFSILAVLLLVIPGVVTFIWWRCRGGRCGEIVITEGRQDCKRKQKDQTEPDVTYSTLTQINTAGAASSMLV